MKKVPNGWKYVRIGDICDVVRGASPRPAGDPRYFDGDYIPWITVAEVTKSYGMYVYETKSFLTEDGSKYTRIIPPNTLVLTNSGATLGVPKITKIKAAANDGIAMLLNPVGTSNEYLYFVLESRTDYFRNHLAPGNGQPNLNTDLIKEESLFLPPTSEQQKITALAVQWDTAIEKTERLIAAKERARVAYGSRLFNGKQSTAFQWLRADQLFTSVSEKGRGELEVLSATQDRGIIPRRMLDKKILMESSNTATFKVVRQGDFVISLRSFQGGLEHSAYEGVVSPAYTVLRPSDMVVPRYFRHYLKSHDFLQRLSVAVIGIRDGKQISFTDFASIKLPIPTKGEQLKYANLLDVLEDEIGVLKKQLELLRQQKRGLMQKLLTGEWRVSLAEKEAA